MDRKKLIKRLLILIFFIFVVNFFANKFYLYSSIWYFDMIMHFLGGFWVGLACLYFFVPKILSLKSILTILLFVLFIGVGWEIFEALVDRVITQNLLNILDLSSDIFFDLSGGALAILYFFKRIMFVKENEIQ